MSASSATGGLSVTVDAEPVAPGTELDAYAASIRARLAGAPSRSAVGPERLVSGGVEAVLHELDWEPPVGPPLRRFDAVWLHDGRGFTASVSMAQPVSDDVRAQIRELLEHEIGAATEGAFADPWAEARAAWQEMRARY